MPLSNSRYVAVWEPYTSLSAYNVLLVGKNAPCGSQRVPLTRRLGDTQVARLERDGADHALLEALQTMRRATGKGMLNALKRVLTLLSEEVARPCSDDHTVCMVTLLVELAFVKDASLYRCYFNSVKSFPAHVLDKVMRGWVLRLEASEDMGDVEALELASAVLAVERFESVWERVVGIGMRRVRSVLERALREADGMAFDDAGEKLVEKAASIGYAFLAKGLSLDRQLLCKVLEDAITAFGLAEENKVEYVLAHLIGSLGCTLVGPRLAIHAVLCFCFGVDSDVATMYTIGIGSSRVSGEDKWAYGLFHEALGRVHTSRVFVVCATLGERLYDEVSAMGMLTDFAEMFAISISVAVEEKYGQTPFVRLYCVDALSAFLGAYLRVSRDADSAVPMLSHDTKVGVFRSLALRSMTCDEYLARRVADSFVRVMFEYDSFQERQLGEPATLAVHTITICAEIPVSKAKFRLWDAIIRRVTPPVAISHCPGFVGEAIRVISTTKDLRAAAASALKNVWKSVRIRELGGNADSAPDLGRYGAGDGYFGPVESEHIVLEVADALVDADIRNDDSLESIVSYVLASLLVVCPGSFMVLMQRLQERGSVLPLGSCIGALGAGRRAGCYAKFSELEPHGVNVFKIMDDAVSDGRESLQLAALELLCAGSTSTIDIPCVKELDILWKYFNTSMVCTSSIARQHNISCFVRFLTRIKASAAATLTRPKDFGAADHDAVQRCQSWMQGFCSLCIACLHPGAVYGKKLMAIELLHAAMQVFEELISREKAACRKGDRLVRDTCIPIKSAVVGSGLTFGSLIPFPDELFSPYTRDLLYGALADNFDRIRSLAMSISLMLPPPDDAEALESASRDKRCVDDMLAFALEYVRRPRLSDIDAGSRMINIVHEQFLIPGSWQVTFRSIDDFEVAQVAQGGPVSSLEFVRVLSSAAIEATPRGSPELPSLGTLLAHLALLRHLVASASFDDVDGSETFLTLVRLVEHTVGLIIPILSSPEDNVIEGNAGLDGEMEGSLAELLSSRASKEQLVWCRSWMASREICIMIRSIWLAVPTRLHAGFGDGLRRTVDALMEILLKAQHYGSIDSAKTALQHICSTRGGALVEGVAHSCVDSLFEHMLRPGQSRRDAIRRSGGMPFGLQSVMVSSPKSRISATIMEKLLDICESPPGDGVVVHWPKVHALNALRLVFSDPRLSGLERYHGTGFRIVLQCLSDPSWEIQNSAALCFTSLVSSKIMGGGAANVRRINHIDVWPTRALSSDGFLGRYREVDRFMLDVLERRPADDLLAPVLALLGRLKPQLAPPGTLSDVEEMGSAGLEAIMQYRELLMRHLGSPQIYIRKLSARACVSVVPAISWHKLLVKECCKGDTSMTDRDHGYPNRLHGRLCLMVEVCKAMHSLPSHMGDQFSAIAGSFCDTFGDTEILNSMPAACHAELLKVCTLMCRLEANYSDERVLACGAKVADVLWMPIMEQRPNHVHPPMYDIARKRIVKLTMAWLLPRRLDGRPGMVLQYLAWADRLARHPSYEVREASLKSLLAAHREKNILDRASGSPAVSQAIDRIFDWVRQSWEAEQAFYAQLLMLRVTNAAQYGVIPHVTPGFLSKYAGNPILLAEIVRSAAYARSTGVEGLLLETSQPCQIEEVRNATVHALGVIGLTSPNHGADSTNTLNMWATALTLMMDEEIPIRSHAAAIVRRALGASGATGATSDSRRVELVQEQVFSWLLQESGCCPDVVQFCIHQIVRDPEESRAALTGCLETRDQHRLFLIEKDNQHQDPLIYPNLAAHALQDGDVNIPREASAAVRGWGTACAQALVDVISLADDISTSLNFGDVLGLRQRMYEDVHRLRQAVHVAAALGFTPHSMRLPRSMQQILDAPEDLPMLFQVARGCREDLAISPRLAGV